METEIDGVEKKPFLPFHPSCIVDSCQQPYPYCDSPFLSLTWVNGLNFHYDKHTGSRGGFYLVNWKMDVLEKAVMSNRFTDSVIWSVIQNKDQKHLCAPTYLVNAVSIEPDPKPSRRLIQHTSASVSPYWVHTTKTLRRCETGQETFTNKTVRCSKAENTYQRQLFHFATPLASHQYQNVRAQYQLGLVARAV